MRESHPTVVVLAAGRGTRLGKKAQDLHKALFAISGQAILSHILGQFPLEWPVVVAIGHLGTQLKDYLELAHPDRHFAFVKVPDFDAPGSGPGASLLACRSAVPGPFYFTAADTVLPGPLDSRSGNWIGVASVGDPSRFCTAICDKQDYVTDFFDKKSDSPSRQAFIGIARVDSAEVFWRSLEGDRELIGGERQVSNGLKGLIPEKLQAITFPWLDTGTAEGFEAARRHFEGGSFDFSKDSEMTYQVNGKVLKWFKNPISIEKRVERARGLAGCVPQIRDFRRQHFVYERVPGHTGYERIDTLNFERLLQWLDRDLWSETVLVDKKAFHDACLNFYREKTLSRLEQFFKKGILDDRPRVVNGVSVPPVRQLMEQIDWKSLAKKAIPSRFHGDLQLDNIVVNDEGKAFTLIDWREDFGGLPFGDRYYDLAKLNGGLLLNYLDIKQGKSLVFDGGADFSRVKVEDLSSDRLQTFRAELETFCRRRELDFGHIELLTSLIYLNMSPLHQTPFDSFLLCFGQWHLARELAKKR